MASPARCAERRRRQRRASAASGRRRSRTEAGSNADIYSDTGAMGSRRYLGPDPITPPRAGRVPTFSVAIAAYEAAAYIGEAVESALAQTLPPHEIIVADDGSADDIEGALAPFGEAVTLLRLPHAGEGAAKRAAAAAASGDFVVILDSDDLFLPERLESLGELAAARPDLDLLTTDAWVEGEG